MPRIGDEQSKAIQEVAKVTGKAIDAVNSVASFLYEIIGQPLENVTGVFISDPIRAYRTTKLIERMSGVQNKMQTLNVKNIRTLAPKFMLPYIEGASVEDVPELQEMWENLLLSAIDSTEEEIENNYVSILKSFTKSDGILLQYLFETRFKKINTIRFLVEPNAPKTEEVLRTFESNDMLNVVSVEEINIRNLLKHGIIESEFEAIRLTSEATNSDTPFDKTIYISKELEEVSFTKFGLDFAARVIDGNTRIVVQESEKS